MIHKSFSISLEKGSIGEEIIKTMLESKGWIVYQPSTEGAHAFDMLSIKDKKQCIAIDVKAKSRMNKYPATGINQKHFENYAYFSKNHNMPFWLFFVDEMQKEIYGNELQTLEEKRIADGIEYPKLLNTANNQQIRLYPLDAMKHIADLSDADVQKLKHLSQRSYEYKPNNAQP